MNQEPTPASSYFVPLGENRFQPTAHAGGAWNPGEIHFSPLGGLITHAIDRHRAGGATAGLQLARVSFDILGFLAAEEITIEVETIRPGRTIELVEARAHIAGRTAVLARAWFLASADTSEAAGGEPERLTPPENLPSWPMGQTWAGGYVNSLDVRPIHRAPGRAAAWLTTPIRLIEGEDASGQANYIALVDTANGIAVRESIDEWTFPNLDLTIHLYRQPVGPWVGLDTSVTFGASGLGLTSTVLHDVNGAVGRAAQTLTVRKRA